MIKKLLLPVSCLSFCLGLQSPAHAQWCVPNTILPYNANMPGITHFVLGTIDRTSSDLENYPNNSYVNTGLSTDLVPGNTYSVTITHTVDASICPDMNLRVWIDYNVDYSFDDAGETVISADHHAAGTYTGSFTVPATAPPGATRLRVTAKMSNLGGHTPPTPCDIPPDPLGYHGEMEDYTANILNTTDVGDPASVAAELSVYPSIVTNHAAISFLKKANSVASITLCNAIGETVWTTDLAAASSGRQEIVLDENVLNGLQAGVYLIQYTGEDQRQAKRLIVL